MRKIVTMLFVMVLCASMVSAQNARQIKLLDASAPMGTLNIANVETPSSRWTPVNLLNTTSTYRGACVAKDGSVWIVGSSTTPVNNYGWRSTDGGKSFTQFFLPAAGSSANQYTNIVAKDKDNAVIGLYTGQIIRTTNGGAKWDTVASYADPATAWIDAVMYVTPDTMMAFGDADASGCYAAISTNAGATWTRFTNLPTVLQEATGYASYSTYGQAHSVVGRTVFMTWYYGSTTPPQILKTTDMGASWTSNAMTLPDFASGNDYYLRSILMLDDQNGFGVLRRVGGTTTDYDSWLGKTTNGGLNWDTIRVEPTQPQKNQKWYSINRIPGTNTLVGTGFSVTTGSKTWMSTDLGATWTPLATPGSSNLTQSAWGSSTLGFAVGYLNVLSYNPSVLVTFLANTAGVPDTMKSTSYVQIRGQTKYTPNALQWNMTSPIKMSNVSGDYWRASYRFQVGDTVDFKFFTNANATLNAEREHQGWEADVASGNRSLIVGQSDTTLPIEYVNGFKDKMPQYDKPFTTNDSTFVMYLRVNMQGWENFNAELHKVGVRGSNATDWGQTGELGWGSSAILTQEQPHANGGSRQYNNANFYNVAIHVPKKYAGQAAEFKFVIHNKTSPDNEDWGAMVANPGPQYHVTLPPTGDTTVYWKWFNDKAPIIGGGKDTILAAFTVDMARAISEQGYKHGDTLQVRTGYGGSGAVVRTTLMKRSGFTSKYTAADTIVGTYGKKLIYQYYTVKNGNEYKEIFFDFNYKGTDNTLAERRTIDAPVKALVVKDTVSSISETRRQPRFRNQTLLARAVKLSLAVDIRPAIYQVASGKDTLKDGQSQFTVTKVDSIMKWGVAVNGPLTALTGGWAGWGSSLKADTTRKLYDDGTHGDKVKNDSIFTRVIPLATSQIVGQEFKFGIGGGDNEGGYGNNHIENINDADTTYYLFTQFGSIDPLFYDTWDFDNDKPRVPLTGVEEMGNVLPTAFALEQNFPNPFNPSTKISFALPKTSHVTLKVYNLLGQEVATLVDGIQKAGTFTYVFNASKLSSGVYFYRLQADNFTSIKKMMLMK